MKSKDNRQLPRTDDVKKWVKEKRHFFRPELLRKTQERPGAARIDFGDFAVAFDGYWTRLRSGNSKWEDRCRFEEVMDSPSLPQCAEYCWKLLMFRGSSEEVWTSMEYLLPIICRGEIKSLKHDGDRLVSGGYEQYVIVIYTWGQEERDKLKRALHSIGFTNIRWRRGCKAFEERFGPWRTWFNS